MIISTEPLSVFICSARADTVLVDELRTHLAPLLNGRVLRILPAPGPGETLSSASSRIRAADLVLVLLSSDLLANNATQLEIIRERSTDGRTVIPVCLRACNWDRTWLCHLQPLPLDSEPVVTHSNRDGVWTSIVNAIAITAQAIRQDSAQRAASWTHGVPMKVLPSFDPAELSSGDDFGGYTLLRKINTGRTSSIWTAVGVESGTPVAVKIPHPGISVQEANRVHCEMRALAVVDSPFVCRLLEVLRTPQFESLVFERLVGESLENRLHRHNTCSILELGPLVSDILEGLSAIHNAGVYHRDLAPRNLIIEPIPGAFNLPISASHWRVPQRDGLRINLRRERVKVIGFGTAKIFRAHRKASTIMTDDDWSATVEYASPEALQGSSSVDERSDTYSVGNIIFRALSGSLPFSGNNREYRSHTKKSNIAMSKFYHDPPSLTDITIDPWAPALNAFLLRSMARSPNNRFQSAAEMLQSWRTLPVWD
jgi:serine/threonine protein kinase